ncbi:uncharacterized protein NECHADRAFT_56375 [Fusarium vanettenii 77-13-4]|uniref:Uncharacterized protein n=1 Tax=Fusarium vanettenii (strain ATCC MYA-4622 / CBS 123669 / FGSC 9596 / NRRL 45880 / 77-13-4) TaxID=660122 RepID=C7ZQT7_FUSV7|nr:uncharacterized protein NECHADRAFT_56375 [Fusarium vanettenii 77-13-4]EEU33627.1 hypothetical protein NECHADRAFT_56375 [Fusarium vanettenii 77-13-4]
MSSKMLAGKVIAVTGAARGIARGTAIYLAERGAILSLSDILEKELEELANEITSRYPDVRLLASVIDIADGDKVDEWVKKTVAEFGSLHGAVNFAGIFHSKTEHFVDIKDEDWHRIMAVNLTGTMFCMRSEIAVMEKGGSIVNASSTAGLMAGPGFVAYAASKAAIISLTRSAAKEIGAQQIRVNALAPAGIVTPMFHQLFDDGIVNEMVITPNALNRDGHVEEVAPLIAFLLGDESRYITGEIIKVDGGMLC